ncbi:MULTISPECIES: class I SAM-dependent methyltransferase [unclassified Mesorhizobium]|uniref:class I SAM-dependent methyltransferase n=1 Tax=unclassified Mesorhizobium TaxID=325217 RepID=UPI001FD9A2B7|nr:MULTISPECIES: class I SAM-dependent methyltransferase [unclassified Mesorhizobium]
MFWLIDSLRPHRFVELGTHTGVSYCAACQAIELLGLSCSCYAIDTWKGDEHAGFYDEGVYAGLATYHDAKYSAFSRLVRSTFDEAVGHFEDESIDLLHIDGMHTYDAVRHDFETWRPKLTKNAIVLFHDTNVRERDFGVFRLWSEVSAGRPHFEFLHGHGLGVLAMGNSYPKAVEALFTSGEQDHGQEAVRTIFAHLGQAVAQRGNTANAIRQAEARFALSLEDWRRQVEQRNSEIEALTAKGEQAEARFAQSLEEQRQQHESEIAALESERAEKAEEFRGLQGEISAANATASALRTERDKEIARARAQTAALQAKIEQGQRAVQEFKDSTSWRITSPLRALLNGRRLLKRVAARFQRVVAAKFR